MSDATDDWLAEDKQLHAGAGFIAGAATVLAIDYLAPELEPWERACIALVPVVLLAVGKEIADKQDEDDHSCDARDAIATVAGGALAITVTFRF